MNSPSGLAVTAVAVFSWDEICHPVYGSQLGACLCLSALEVLGWLYPCVSAYTHAFYEWSSDNSVWILCVFVKLHKDRCISVPQMYLLRDS